MGEPQIQNAPRRGKTRMPRITDTLLRVAENFRRYRAMDPSKLRKDATGLKRQYIPGAEPALTPYGAKLRRRRRAARRVAHESRRRNHRG